MVSNEIYLLPLKDDGSPDVSGGYIYLTPKGTEPITVRFAIEGTSSICREGSLWVNIPEKGVEFQRDQFREFKLEPDFNRTIEISIPIHSAGAFAFYTTYKALPDLDDTSTAPIETTKSPQLPLPALSVFSVISKFMGKYPKDWEKHLRGISERGYNMVHFTPLQKRGESNSPYSIYDQLSWDPECFPNGEKDIKKLVKSMEDNHGLLGLTDVVWNHTANNSAWLEEHPEVGYNVSTAPWLRSALELDTKLLEFSKDLAKLDLPTTLNSVDDLAKVMAGVKTEVIAKLHGGFGGSGFGGLEAIKNASVTDQATFLREQGMLNTDRLGERYRRKVDPEVGAALLTALFGRFEGDKSNGADRAEARSRLTNVLDEVNLPYYKEYDVDVAEILDQLFNRTKYVRLDDNGPKLGPIDDKNPLIETYFTRLPKNSTTSKHNQEDLALANNGWIWAANALVDNAGPKSRAYLRREVIVWGDCVKLRYGESREDSPFLWDFMAKYTRLMANYFTGFRIDNAHSTPIHVAEFLLDEARRIRPNLYVVAELFTGSEEMDYVFVKRLGLSSLIREAMQAWSTGELVEIVHETRLYTSASSEKEVKTGAGEGGIGGVKKLLNQIHSIMGKDGYAETYIHHEDQYITVHRVHPESRKGYFLIAHTAFPGYGNGNGGFNPVHLGGTKASHLGSWMLEVDTSEEAKKDVLEDKKYLRGLPSKVSNLPGVRMEYKDGETTISVRDKFPPGSIALFETWIPAAEHATGLDTFVTSGAKAAFSELDLVDLNVVLYKCEAEERDASEGKDGVYDIPGHGKLVYAGLQGWWSVLKNIIKDNNLGHPMCNHLREGQWALDYIIGRLEKMSNRSGYERLQKPTAWLKERFDAIRKMPSFLLPRYFGLVIRTAYRAAWERSLALMNENVREGQWFLQDLAMVSVQQTGYVNSASLYPKKAVPSLAAGLPHFAVEWARCWGRDVFISARGLFLGTGRYAEAREHILAFSSVLKHDYTKIVPNGLDLLKEKVPRRFLPYDDTFFDSDDPRAYSKTSVLEDIIQESLQRHASGMSFREANAGPNLDMQMSSEGFNIDIKVDWSNGLIFGGNQNNCGTWMDKMGESERAKSKGVPGTPRDGAAIEITGLLYSTLRWVAELHEKGKYKYAGVSTSDPKMQVITFSDWADKIKKNFERCYYVPLDAKDDSKYDVNTPIVNRRGIYKDLYKSGKDCPDLFDDAHALNALFLADKVLRGPTGMATLDPADLNYRPYYINSEDSEDFSTSKGRNYHQGPEWLWPTGFFLRALLKFDLKRRKTPAAKTEAFQQITRRLAGCKEAIVSSDWAGLTELTQKDGAYCPDSSPTQAWSAGCLIDLYHDAAQYDVSQLSK
ncbi:Glycogen debranching enzyme [Botrytis cinerea]